MPKLNVQQNNQNVIQAFKNALAIGNLKGIIASDGSHNFSTAGSNRNLLDNPFFTAGNVVNQRGVATIPHTQYGIDRWKGELGSATITVTDAGLAYQGTSADIYQPMESALRTFLNGKTLTASVLKSDGTIESGSAVFTNGAKTQFIHNSETGGDVFISAAGNFNLRYLNRTSATTVVAAKLELGSASTLANDAPPDYGEELAKCQRYFARIKTIGTYPYAPLGIGAYTNSTTIRMGIFTPVPMRAVPSGISFSGSLIVRGGGNEYTVNSIGVIDATLNTAFANVVVSSAPTAHHTYTMLGTTGSYVDISADL